MARGKSTKLKPFEKLLTIMVTGKPVTVEEIDATLGKEIYMYRLSTYMWHIKTMANGVVRAIKDGRRVTAYQLVNVEDIKKYLDMTGVSKSGFVPGAVEKKPSISKLADLKATPVTPAVAKTPKAPKKTKKVKEPEVMEAVEVTETESV
jgi:hypothetical protein